MKIAVIVEKFGNFEENLDIYAHKNKTCVNKGHLYKPGENMHRCWVVENAIGIADAVNHVYLANGYPPEKYTTQIICEDTAVAAEFERIKDGFEVIDAG